MENKEKVINTLKEAATPLKAGEIAEKSGIEKKEVDKIIKVLKADDLLFSPKRCYYDVKK